MAYYIAEQITTARRSKGKAKVRAERECFETILKLWQHIAYVPAGKRPFEDFEPVFRALPRLDSDNPLPFFYSSRQRFASTPDTAGGDLDDVQKWLDVAGGIDHAARVWLEYVFQQAALSALDKGTIEWLEHGILLSNGRDEASIIVRLIDDVSESSVEETVGQAQQARQSKLEAEIKRLDAFAEFSQILRSALVTELQNLKQHNSSSAQKGDEHAQE